MKPLRIYLSINSLFSAISGLTLLLGSNTLNDWFGFSNPYIFPVIGLNLLVFSAFVIFVSTKQVSNKALVNTITLLDLLWVLGSLVILAFNLFDIAVTGKILIGIVAIWIGFLAYQQFQYNK